MKYLGYFFTSDGMMTELEKNQIINRNKAPISKTQLQRLLGRIKLLHKFMHYILDRTGYMSFLLKECAAFFCCCWN